MDRDFLFTLKHVQNHWSRYVVHLFGHELQFSIRGKGFLESVHSKRMWRVWTLNLNQMYILFRNNLAAIWRHEIFVGSVGKEEHNCMKKVLDFWFLKYWKLVWWRLMKLPANAMPFTLWTISSFWNDDWTELRSLLVVMGPNGLGFRVSQL